jgi:hypothetical protein
LRDRGLHRFRRAGGAGAAIDSMARHGLPRTLR